MDLTDTQSGSFALPSFILPEVDRGPGVYFLLLRAEVVYIGSSTRDVLARSCQHFGQKLFDEVSYVRTPIEWNDQFVRMAEMALIRWCRPVLNKEPSSHGALYGGRDQYWWIPSDTAVAEWARKKVGERVVSCQPVPNRKIVLPPSPPPPIGPASIDFSLWDAYVPPSFIALYKVGRLAEIGIRAIDDSFPRPFSLFDTGSKQYVLVRDIVDWVNSKRIGAIA